MKKTILHVIFSLGRGGAETMLVRYISELQEYYNIVVILKNENHFEGELVCDQFICLNKPSLFSIPFAALSLRSLIKKHRVDLVHSHLPVSNFVARLATPDKIPLITTIHNSIAKSKDYGRSFIRLLDKSTYLFRKSTVIAVSNGALSDYFSVLKMKPGNTILLYNFVDINKYKQVKKADENRVTFRAVCVAALSRQKNIGYLIQAFGELKGLPLELHIYGQGELKDELQQLIDKYQAPVILKGQVKNIHEILPEYDLFTMSSSFEGFSLSVLEAMAMQVPLLLSDITSFREQCEETAIYFDLEDVQDYVRKIKNLAADENHLNKLGLAAKERAVNNFSLTQFMESLRKIYNNSLNQKFN